VVVGFVDPLDVEAIADVERQLDRTVEVAVVEESKLLAVVDRIYRRTAEISGLARELERDLGTSLEGAVDLGQMSLTARAEDAPVVRLLQTILADAARARASDIHIEPQASGVQIRFRIDGVLSLQTQLDSKIGPALVLRLKIVAGLDIAEKRLPQDGRFVAQLDGMATDMRLSTLPTQHGESVVMRLLGRQGLLLSLDELGMPESMLRAVRSAAQRASGMVLVTGPTGSGKTNTLYSAISQLNTLETNIMTAEDPVEFNLAGVNQVNVRESIGLTFAAALRSFLRQDPNIILVGEIRDFETAEIAVKAALTGHLVLSTLHTNDAPSTVSRLMNMGIEPFLVASSVNLICAQRLVRRVCAKCKVPHPVPPQALIDIGFSPEDAQVVVPMKGQGCDTCNRTGYKGRVGLYEVLEVTDQMRELILTGASALDLRRKGIEEGMITLRQSGLLKVKEGVTTTEEVTRETVK
jgi:type IV pilus assembly protein PilB